MLKDLSFLKIQADQIEKIVAHYEIIEKFISNLRPTKEFQNMGYIDSYTQQRKQ
jgi:hypothetical protein